MSQPRTHPARILPLPFPDGKENFAQNRLGIVRGISVSVSRLDRAACAGVARGARARGEGIKDRSRPRVPPQNRLHSRPRRFTLPPVGVASTFRLSQSTRILSRHTAALPRPRWCAIRTGTAEPRTRLKRSASECPPCPRASRRSPSRRPSALARRSRIVPEVALASN